MAQGIRPCNDYRRTLVTTSRKKLEIGPKDGESGRLYRKMKSQRSEIEIAGKNEKRKKDLPFLTAVEAATALVTTAISACITSTKTSIIVIASAAELFSSGLIE